jgi:hypothetical protein
VERRTDASPLGPDAGVPVVHLPLNPGAWQGAAIHLSENTPTDFPHLVIEEDVATVTWPDATPTSIDLNHVLAH